VVLVVSKENVLLFSVGNFRPVGSRVVGDGDAPGGDYRLSTVGSTLHDRASLRGNVLLVSLVWFHPFNGLFSRTSCVVSRCKKGRTILDFNEVEMMGGSGIS